MLFQLKQIGVALLVFHAVPLTAAAQTNAKPQAAAGERDQSSIRAAVRKSITLIEKSGYGYREHRQCFSCHHQAMPVIALTEAKRRGFAVDEKNLKLQLEWTIEHLKRGRENYLKGRGQGGAADTAGYALWTLDAGEWKADETTDAVIEYLLRRNNNLSYWRRSGNRPPSEASNFTTTYVALRAFDFFGSKRVAPQRERSRVAPRREIPAAERPDYKAERPGYKEKAKRITTRKKKALGWLLRTKGKDTEDRIFRLRSLHRLGADEKLIRSLSQELLEAQRDDGGWAQLPKMKSDAYATGSVLVTLHRVGAMEISNPKYQRGLEFLLKTQLDDGSWFVHSRSKPFQKYFESGYPHRKDQFISITASCWATTALVLACQEKE